MATSVRIEKRLPDGRILFCKDGVYFALTLEQVQQLYALTFPKDEGKVSPSSEEINNA